MITLAVLYYLASIVGGEVDKDWFYEDWPIDPETGAVTKDGVFGQTLQAPKGQGDDYHTFIDIMALVAENTSDANGELIPEKQATDRLIDRIEDAVTNALDDVNSYVLTIPTTGERFYDVRITPSTGKMANPPLPDGTIAKSLEIEVWYKKG